MGERSEETNVHTREVMVPVSIVLSVMEGVDSTHIRTRGDLSDMSWLPKEWQMRLCFSASCALAAQGMRLAREAGVPFEDAMKAAQTPYAEGYTFQDAAGGEADE